jgi:hypothetical protein
VSSLTDKLDRVRHLVQVSQPLGRAGILNLGRVSGRAEEARDDKDELDVLTHLLLHDLHVRSPNPTSLEQRAQEVSPYGCHGRGYQEHEGLN